MRELAVFIILVAGISFILGFLSGFVTKDEMKKD